MTVIGVTGSMGAGKSTLCSWLKMDGFCTFDADESASTALSTLPVQKHLAEKTKRPLSLFQNSNILKEEIKKNPSVLDGLDRIIHPIVFHEAQEFIAENCSEKQCVLDVPLLFESGIDKICDVVITVYCDAQVRKKRLDQRGQDSVLRDILEQRHMTDHEKRNLADFCVNMTSEKMGRIDYQGMLKKLQGINQ